MLVNITDAIVEARRLLRDYADEAALAAYFIRDRPEVEAAGLTDLAWLLAGERYGCHRNDVLGLIELLEKHLAQSKENELS
mgnify:CR=1 FL=1